MEYLAEIFGADQPVYGMRSASQIFKSWEQSDLTGSLASFYIKEMKSIQPKGSYLLGGNCQAADISKSMADQLHKKEGSVAMLVLLNSLIQEKLDYPLTLLFGEKDRYNPFYNKSENLSRWRASFPTYHLKFVTGSHGQYFSMNSDFSKRFKETIESYHCG